MSLARFSERDRPDLAAMLPLHRAQVGAELARRLLSEEPASQNGTRAASSRLAAERASRLSHTAAEREPLALRALANLALLEAASGKIDRARGTMHSVARLSRRERVATAWLLDDAARRGEVREALALLDQLLRESPAARQEAMPVLVAQLANAAMVEPVHALLSARPPWEEAFWRTAFTSEAALGNVALLRLRLDDEGYPANARNDSLLIGELARTGNFSAGSELYHALVGPPDPVRLAPEQPYPPFDLQVFREETVTASLEPQSNALRLALYPASHGGELLARKLVFVPGGEVLVELEMAGWSPQDREALSLSLACAEPSTTPAAASPRAIVAERETMALRSGAPGCRWHWLEIRAAPRQRSADQVLRLEKLAVRPRASEQ